MYMENVYPVELHKKHFAELHVHVYMYYFSKHYVWQHVNVHVL